MNKQIVVLVLMLLYFASALSAECIVLLHGLARTSNSMNELEQKLTRESYYVANIDYPSRKKEIIELSEIAINEGLARCHQHASSPVNFVTHSLGGILVRQYYKNHSPENVKRVIMLGPPNNGSEVVDSLKNMPGYELLNGPAGQQLGTGNDDLPKRLGAVNFELGVIAGTRSINLILSTFLPNPDDGKVSVESTKVDGMCGFVTLPVSHPFLMTDDQAISEVINFLAYGKFKHESAINFCHNEYADEDL
ncbi:Lipase [hydrothermal vent metagenome]|uniref:Lipase n=1 Tax=hydrothermal vent metagenome TaxID=652676 RepID=A0A3B0ZJB3_9ZZZZ